MHRERSSHRNQREDLTKRRGVNSIQGVPDLASQHVAQNSGNPSSYSYMTV